MNTAPAQLAPASTPTTTPVSDAEIEAEIDAIFEDHELALDAKYGAGKWHCDDIWAAKEAPECVIAYLDNARAPAAEQDYKNPPKLFATAHGKRVRVVMASRFGDVGVSNDLTATSGYGIRFYLPDLTDFSDTP